MLTEAANATSVEGVKAAAARMPIGRYGQPQEVAKLIAFLLSDESSYSTGTVASIDGGWNC